MSLADGDQLIEGYQIQPQPEGISGESVQEYAPEIDAYNNGEVYDDQDRVVVTTSRKVAKKRVYLPQIALIEPRSRIYANTSQTNE